MGKSTVLFDGKIGTQSECIRLEWRDGDLLMSSQALGPALVPHFGENETEVFLTVRAAQLPQLARALACRPTTRSIKAAVVDRYHGDSSATSHFTALLKRNKIRHEFYQI